METVNKEQNKMSLVKKDIKIREKNEYVYVISSEFYAFRNMFKIVGKITQSEYKQFISKTKPNENELFVVHIVKTYNSESLLKRIDDNMFRFKHKTLPSFYHSNYDNVIKTVNLFSTNYNKEIEIFNSVCKKLIDNSGSFDNENILTKEFLYQKDREIRQMLNDKLL